MNDYVLFYKRRCRSKEEHRLYYAIGCECPCYEEMLKAEKRLKEVERRFKKAVSKMLRSLV